MEPNNIDYRLRVPFFIETSCLALMFDEKLRVSYPGLGIKAWQLWNQKLQMDGIVQLISNRMANTCLKNETQSVQIIIDALAETLSENLAPITLSGASISVKPFSFDK
ncbi:hypothetical protein HB779_22875 (plasmid) [Phyllobacterium sp. 628]|uniref:hypothetical protein n=1 Tax=Phyllobacterium sp. 628 TaxID=2718938 RepID=UPI0016626782|nr:hypothetical protein [Phyllobacterium sp. 628]QND54755.1 hypothetical protein HB779_22875 [Phyllobacterium sp. 628]